MGFCVEPRFDGQRCVEAGPVNIKDSHPIVCGAEFIKDSNCIVEVEVVVQGMCEGHKKTQNS